MITPFRALLSLLAVSIVAELVDGIGQAVADDANAQEYSNALAQYVAKNDDSYKWVKTRSGTFSSVEFTELILTSQTWRDIPWKHQLQIIKPSSVADDCKQAILVVAGGRWRDEYENPPAKFNPPREAALFVTIAEQLKSPVAVLQQVPQQPMFDGLVEDEIISLTFEKFIRTQDQEWPLLLPMVKSAVRGMDTVQKFAKKEWGLEIENFTVTGASKRGWTTWLTGAVDKRANAIAPMVIDTLNMAPQMKHQLFAWGKYSEQIADYTERGIQGQIATPAGAALRAIVDPYSYREKLMQPKLLIIGTNDRYWPLDALNLYWDDLIGSNYILYVPNNGHGIRDYTRVVGSLTALHRHATGDKKLPVLKWDFDPSADGITLSITSKETPTAVNIWTAKSATRDFRDAQWISSPADEQDRKFRFRLSTPKKGYAAVFGEAVYPGTPSFATYLSTNVRIVHADGSDDGPAASP